MLMPSSAWARDGSAASSRRHTLVIGRVTDDPKKHYAHLKPLLLYVAEHMKDLGITATKVRLAKNNDQMTRYLKQGQVDWVTETLFSTVIFQDEAGAEPLLRRWKGGVSRYHTVFFTRMNSAISSLADLTGKTIAFEDPGSTSAYVVPAAILVDTGLALTPLGSPREKPPTAKVGYVFSGHEINTSTWVYQGIVDVGVLSNLDWENEEHLPLAFKHNLKIIHQTRQLPRAVELVRAGLDPRIKQRLTEILLNAHNDADAQTALQAYQQTTKFDQLDNEFWKDLEEVRRLLKILQTQLR